MNDIIDRLEAANPFPTDHSTDRPKQSADQLFADITETAAAGTEAPEDTPAQDTVRALDDRRSRRTVRRRVLAIAAVIAAALLMTVAAVVAGPGSTDAQAGLTRAAQAAAGFDSGQADVHIVGTGLPGELQSLDATSTYTYNGDDYRFIETGARPDGSEYIFELRRVDERFYWSSPGSPGLFVPGSIDEFAYLESLESTFSFNPKAAGLDSLVEVFESADDVTQQDNGLVSIYAATISRDALAQLNRAQVPPGLAIIAGPSAEELPSDVAMRATVQDGVLSQLEIIIDGEAAAGPMTAQITTVLSGLGSTGPISAPADDTVIDVPPLLAIADLEALGVDQSTLANAIRWETVFDDLRTRRPRLCIEFGTSMFEGKVQSDQMEALIVEFEELATCYQQAGETAAADLSREGADGWRVALEETLSLDDVEARRPGLCDEYSRFVFSDDDDRQQAYRDSRTAWANCLSDAGESRAAAALQKHLDEYSYIFFDEE